MVTNPFIFSDEPKYRIRRHLAFWVFWWLVQGVLYSVIGMPSEHAYSMVLLTAIIESLAFMVIHMFLSYALMYFVIPRYLLQQKYWLTAIWVLICFLGTAIISTIISATIIPEIERIVLHETDYHLRERALQRVYLS